MFPVTVTIQKQIHVPLNDISGVCILFVYRFVAKLCPVILGTLVIFAIPNVIGKFRCQIRLFDKSLTDKHVVNQFTISLLC